MFRSVEIALLMLSRYPVLPDKDNADFGNEIVCNSDIKKSLGLEL